MIRNVNGPAGTTAEKERAGRGVVNRIEALLRVVGMASEGITVSQLARRVGMDTGLVYRYAVSLTRTGFLQRDGQRRYHLGQLIDDLAATRRAALGRSSSEFVAAVVALQEATGEAVSILRWTPNGPQAVWVLDNFMRLPVTLRLGAVLPLLATAGGQVCLAFADRTTVDRLLRLELANSKATLGVRKPSAFDIDDMVRQVAKRRVARSRGYLHGLSAMSSPLMTEQGEFWGCITVTGPSSRFDWGWRGRNAALLKALSADLLLPQAFDAALPLYYPSRMPSTRPQRTR